MWEASQDGLSLLVVPGLCLWAEVRQEDCSVGCSGHEAAVGPGVLKLVKPTDLMILLNPQ